MEFVAYSRQKTDIHAPVVEEFLEFLEDIKKGFDSRARRRTEWNLIIQVFFKFIPPHEGERGDSFRYISPHYSLHAHDGRMLQTPIKLRTSAFTPRAR